jgi:hypothetical protein
MRFALLLAALAVVPKLASTQGPNAAPPYQRTRLGADLGRARGGSYARGPSSYGGIYDPYFFAPVVVAESWYQRPYPYHLDYYRHRWGGAAIVDQATTDCPCAAAFDGVGVPAAIDPADMVE